MEEMKIFGSDRQTRFVYGAVLLGLGLAFVLVRVLYLQEPWNSDDIVYYEAARSIADGSHPVLNGDLTASKDPHLFRFGLVIPTALAIQVLGDNYAAFYAFPMLFSVAGFLLIILFLRRYLPFPLVVAMALVHVVFPFEIRHASILFTDLPSALFILLIVVHICWVAEKEISRKQLILHAALSGFLLFWSYLLRTNQFLVAAPAIGFLVFTKKTRRLIIVAVGVAAILFLAEQAVYALQGGGFNYRWALEKGNIANWMPHFKRVTWSEYPLRYFAYVKSDLGMSCLVFVCLSLLLHVITFIRYRQTAIRVLMLNGIFVFGLFWYYIFKYSEGVLYVMNEQHRFIQLFYYTSLLAVPLGFYAAVQSIATYATKFQKTKWVSRVTRKEYLVVYASLSVGVFVLPFVSVIRGFNTNLVSSKNEYNMLFKSIDRRTGDSDKITICGEPQSLRNISLFKYPMIGKEVTWRGVGAGTLQQMVNGRSKSLFLIDRHRMQASIRYSAKKSNSKIIRTRYKKLLLGLSRNYKAVHQSSRFLLYRLSESTPVAKRFPNWDFGQESGTERTVSGWWLSDPTNCGFVSRRKGLLTIRCNTKAGYLVSGSKGSFSKPAAGWQGYRLTAGKRYRFEVVATRVDKSIKLRMWVVQYSANKRIGHKVDNIELGENILVTQALEEAQSFRIMLRIAGSGVVSIGSIRVHEH